MKSYECFQARGSPKAWVPLNHAPLHWRLATDYELASDDLQKLIGKASDEKKSEHSLIIHFDNVIHNMGRKHEVIIHSESGDIVIFDISGAEAVETLRAPFWAIGTSCLPCIPSKWRLARHKALWDAAIVAWRTASDQFIKAASRNICVAVGIRKGDPKRALEYIPAQDWQFEIHELPTDCELEDGSLQPLPPECYPGKRYMVGPKIDWELNSFEALDGTEWIDIQVAKNGTNHPDIKSNPKKRFAARPDARDWLIKLMQESPDLKPYPKRHYLSEAQSKFHIGKAQFNKIWGEAINQVGATGWGKPGRPKKHPEKIESRNDF